MLRSNVSERERHGDRFARMDEVLSRQRGRGKPRRHSRPSASRRRLAAFAFVTSFALFLTSLGLSTVSAPLPAERILGRAVPVLSEEDGLLALHLSDLRAQAAAAGTRLIPLPWFPIVVSLPAPLLANAPTQTIELAIDRLAAEALYKRGEAAFVAGSGRAHVTGPLLSPTWTLRQALTLLNARAHTRLLLGSGLLALLAVLLALLYGIQLPGDGWPAPLGAAAMAGALLAGVVAVIAWLLVQLSAAGAPSPLGDAAWGMWSDVTWTMLMIDAAAVVCGAAVLFAGVVLARLARSASKPAPAGSRGSAEPLPSGVPAPAGQRPLDRLPRARRRLD